SPHTNHPTSLCEHTLWDCQSSHEHGSAPHQPLHKLRPCRRRSQTNPAPHQAAESDSPGDKTSDRHRRHPSSRRARLMIDDDGYPARDRLKAPADVDLELRLGLTPICVWVARAHYVRVACHCVSEAQTQYLRVAHCRRCQTQTQNLRVASSCETQYLRLGPPKKNYPRCPEAFQIQVLLGCQVLTTGPMRLQSGSRSNQRGHHLCPDGLRL